jgi:GTP-binding protein
LNALAGTRVAKVSGTPGKTRMMNVFRIALKPGVWERGDAGPHTHTPTPRVIYFLDLPGYGYSRASKTERTAFRRLVAHALRRERLAGVVWLLDIRHEPSAGDNTMQDLLAATGMRVLATVTKSDKLGRAARERRGRELRETLGIDADQLIVTSAKTGEGIADLREAIAGLIGESA